MATTKTRTWKHSSRSPTLASALKAPRITEATRRLADHARDAGWMRSTSPQSSTAKSPPATPPAPSCGSGAGFGARKTIEEFGLGRPTRRAPTDRVPGIGRVPHRNQERRCWPPAPAKPTWPPGLGIAAAHHGHRVLFATATDWSPGSPTPTAPAGSPTTHPAAPLRADHRRRSRLPAFEQDAELFFQLVSSRCDTPRSSSSTCPWRLGRRFGDRPSPPR